MATLLVVFALFLPQVVGGFYEAVEREVPESYPILSSLFLALSLFTWFSMYSQKRRIPWVMDMGWFFLAAWMILIPYCILKREGRAGLARIGLFCLTWLAAWGTGWAVKVWTQVILGAE